jgi:hypothetical protein
MPDTLFRVPADLRLRPYSTWRAIMDTKTVRIQQLNDQFRQRLTGGIAVMAPGVAALGSTAVERIVKTVQLFDDFCHDNDPWQEHDFGAFDAEGGKIFFKIDYFGKGLRAHSPDASDPAVTERVITLMLAEEY